MWRNSDDFFPKKPESHGRHIAWNALNSLWSANFVTPDWDMFWSGHSEGEFHAMARAISGGPVYVSDKPGDHDFAVLEKLVTSDGRVLRSDRPGLPAADRIFVDCQSAVALMKVTNRSGAIGVMGLFNCRDEAGVVADELMPGDIHDLEGSEFAVWLHKAQRLEKVKRRQKVAVELPQLKSEIAVVSPIMDRWIAPLGLIEKYNAPAAVRRCELTAEGVLVADIADGGVMGFWCASEPRVVAVSRKAKITYAEHLLRIEVKPGAEVRVRIVK